MFTQLTKKKGWNSKTSLKFPFFWSCGSDDCRMTWDARPEIFYSIRIPEGGLVIRKLLYD